MGPRDKLLKVLLMSFNIMGPALGTEEIKKIDFLFIVAA